MFVPILAYHKIQNEFELGLSYITPGQFEKQIKYLHENGYRTVSIADYVHKNSLPDRSVIITFDDAYESIHANALPILKKYNYTATFFVITKFVGDWNRWDYHFERFKFYHCSWEQIKFLANQGWEVGSHTVSHANMRNLTRKEAWYEIRYSRDILENHLEMQVKIISYPFGWFDDKIINLVKDAGYQAACTLGQIQSSVANFPFALPRRGLYIFEPFALFKNKLLNNYISHCDDIKQRFFSAITQKVSQLKTSRSG